MPMGSLEEQLRPQLLSGLAYERLLAEIVSGRLPPGQRLRLDLLAHSWAVSRTPVREALQRLADMRFVHVSPNAGTRVAAWSISDMIERARVIGALLDSESRAALPVQGLAGGSRPAVAGCELVGYLELAEHLIAHEFGRLGAHIVRDHIEPLRLFVEPETARRHGVDFESGRALRRELLATAHAAVVRQNPTAVRDALRSLSSSVIDALASASAAVAS